MIEFAIDVRITNKAQNSQHILMVTKPVAVNVVWITKPQMLLSEGEKKSQEK